MRPLIACLLELGIVSLQAPALLLELQALLPVQVKAQDGWQRHLLNGLCQKIPKGSFHQLGPLLREARLQAARLVKECLYSWATDSPAAICKGQGFT